MNLAVPSTCFFFIFAFFLVLLRFSAVSSSLFATLLLEYEYFLPQLVVALWDARTKNLHRRYDASGLLNFTLRFYAGISGVLYTISFYTSLSLQTRHEWNSIYFEKIFSYTYIFITSLFIWIYCMYIRAWKILDYIEWKLWPGIYYICSEINPRGPVCVCSRCHWYASFASESLQGLLYRDRSFRFWGFLLYTNKGLPFLGEATPVSSHPVAHKSRIAQGEPLAVVIFFFLCKRSIKTTSVQCRYTKPPSFYIDDDRDYSNMATPNTKSTSCMCQHTYT